MAGSLASTSVHMTAFEIVGERIIDLLAPALPPRRVQRPTSPGQHFWDCLSACRAQLSLRLPLKIHMLFNCRTCLEEWG